MEGQDDHLQSGEDKATELENEHHQGTISKDSTKKSIQDEIADTVNNTEEEVGGEANVQSNKEEDTDDEDNQMPTELDDASKKGSLIIYMDVNSTETTGAEPEIIEDVSQKKTSMKHLTLKKE